MYAGERGNRPLIVFGAGMIARAVIIVLKEKFESDQLNLIGCAVTNTDHNVSDIEGVPVYSMQELIRKYRDAHVLLAIKEQVLPEIEHMFNQLGVKDYSRVSYQCCIPVLETKWRETAGERAVKFLESLDRRELTDEEYVMFLSKQLKRDVLNFEVNLADHCNLNCQCCNHFSPLAEPHFLDIEQYKRDLLQLSRLFDGHIGRVMLLGGEPLLNPDILGIFRMTRQCLPKASVYISTNGLLLPQMKQEFWDMCKQLNIGIKVTKYPVKFDYAAWEDFAYRCGVEMSDENPEPVKTTYRLPLKEEGGLNPFRNYIKCYHANQCVVLREGRLYICPQSAYVDYLNQYYGKHIPQRERNSIDIYVAKSSEEIDSFMKGPVAMCEHCDIYNYTYGIPWKVSGRSLEEWM